MGGRGEGFSGTIIKDTWIKPRWEWGGSKGGRVAGSKCRQLYLKNNIIIFKNNEINEINIVTMCVKRY